MLLFSKLLFLLGLTHCAFRTPWGKLRTNERVRGLALSVSLFEMKESYRNAHAFSEKKTPQRDNHKRNQYNYRRSICFHSFIIARIFILSFLYPIFIPPVSPFISLKFSALVPATTFALRTPEISAIGAGAADGAKVFFHFTSFVLFAGSPMEMSIIEKRINVFLFWSLARYFLRPGEKCETSDLLYHY